MENSPDTVYGIPRKQWDMLPFEVKRHVTDLHNQAAHAKHASQNEYTKSRRLEAWNAASMVLTSLATLNSGALVALLALLGALISKGNSLVTFLDIAKPLSCFGLGLLFALGAMFAAFFAVGDYMTLAKRFNRFLPTRSLYIPTRWLCLTAGEIGRGYLA